MGKSAFARERTSSEASGLPFLLLSIEPFSGVPLLSFSLSPKVLFFLQQRSRMRRRWRMGNKGSFCEQDAPSSLSPKGRPTESMMDTRYETFYSLPPKCLSFLNLVVPAPFDIGKVERLLLPLPRSVFLSHVARGPFRS